MADLKNIALTVEATSTANDLKESFGVTEQMDLIRLGFAYAVKHGASPDRDEHVGTRGGSNYDTGGLDHDGLMAATVKIYYPEPAVVAEPYRAVETLMNKGLRLLGEHVNQGIVGSISDLVDTDSHNS